MWHSLDPNAAAEASAAAHAAEALLKETRKELKAMEAKNRKLLAVNEALRKERDYYATTRVPLEGDFQRERSELHAPGAKASGDHLIEDPRKKHQQQH